MPSSALLISIVAITTAWQFPSGRYDGSAQDPYINVTCDFENGGPHGPAVYLGDQCNPSSMFSISERAMKLTRDTAHRNEFGLMPAEKASGVFSTFIRLLNVLCPGRGFTVNDFSKFRVTSAGGLEIREESRQISLKKVDL